MEDLCRIKNREFESSRDPGLRIWQWGDPDCGFGSGEVLRELDGGSLQGVKRRAGEVESKTMKGGSMPQEFGDGWKERSYHKVGSEG